jgi:predicted acyltransferase
MSLDALRGFDMFWIVGGAAILQALAKVFPGAPADRIAAQLEHVPWQGLHFFDWIWPLFMFIMGVAMPFSLAKRRAAGATNREIYAHAAVRGVILFVLGMVAQGNLLAFDCSKLHPCYSVLHGIAAGYLIAMAVLVNFRPAWQAALTGMFLIAFWALLMLIPVPGFGSGVLTPEGNAAAYVDHVVLGSFSYGLNTWFLSYLGFASSVLLGVLAGEFLAGSASARKKVGGLVGAGCALVALGLVWSLCFPIIKPLWTSSFVLVTGGLSAIVMGVFYLLIDVLGFRRWAFPFTVIGMNALAVYMATMLFDFRHIGNIFVGSLAPRIGVWGGVLEASAALAVEWLILLWMYRTKTFVKI